MQTNIASAIDLANMKDACDTSCKKLLSNKIILAWILKSTVEEFKDIAIRDISERYIEGNPLISQVYVNPGETNSNDTKESIPEITGRNTENNILNEGKVSFDIIFNVIFPKSKKTIKMIINLEAQSNYYPGYAIETRGVYYGSRMISSQYGTEFVNSHYENIKKVYSIWICINPPQKDCNTITEFQMCKKDIIGDVFVDLSTYDLISVILIRLGGKDYKNYEGIIKLLDVLFSAIISPTEKKRILENEFNIPISKEQGKEIEDMCNISEGIWQDGMEKGMEKGMDAFARLTEKLIRDSRTADLLRATNDKKVRSALYREYNIAF